MVIRFGMVRKRRRVHSRIDVQETTTLLHRRFLEALYHKPSV
jgi:hypothetical protein